MKIDRFNNSLIKDFCGICFTESGFNDGDFLRKVNIPRAVKQT